MIYCGYPEIKMNLFKVLYINQHNTAKRLKNLKIKIKRKILIMIINHKHNNTFLHTKLAPLIIWIILKSQSP